MVGLRQEHVAQSTSGYILEGMAEIVRQITVDKAARPWDAKLGNDKIERTYSVQIQMDGRFEVVEAKPSFRDMHHSGFVNRAEAEEWVACRRNSSNSHNFCKSPPARAFAAD